MKIGKGIVKKYSREYHRTLKNGERKKYTTEQIQITVPKTRTFTITIRSLDNTPK